MSGEDTIDYQFYILEKKWITDVNNTLMDHLSFIMDLIKRVSKWSENNKLDYNDLDNAAWVNKNTLHIQSQNFEFMVTDNEWDYKIEYKILDEYTKNNVERMLGIKSTGYFLEIYKDQKDAEPLFYISHRNYDYFIEFIRETEFLDFILQDIGA